MNAQDFHPCGFQDHQGSRCHRTGVEFVLIPWIPNVGAYLCPVHRMLFEPPRTPWKVYLEEGGRYIENVGVQIR